jgi:hypothetical protein
MAKSCEIRGRHNSSCISDYEPVQPIGPKIGVRFDPACLALELLLWLHLHFRHMGVREIDLNGVELDKDRKAAG